VLPCICIAGSDDVPGSVTERGAELVIVPCLEGNLGAAIV
jgi:hypothetical protein